MITLIGCSTEEEVDPEEQQRFFNIVYEAAGKRDANTTNPFTSVRGLHYIKFDTLQSNQEATSGTFKFQYNLYSENTVNPNSAVCNGFFEGSFISIDEDVVDPCEENYDPLTCEFQPPGSGTTTPEDEEEVVRFIYNFRLTVTNFSYAEGTVSDGNGGTLTVDCEGYKHPSTIFDAVLTRTEDGRLILTQENNSRLELIFNPSILNDI